MAWIVNIGQEDDLIGVRTQDRITNIRVMEEFGNVEFSVTIKNPIISEKSQPKGRIDAAIIQIKRRSGMVVEGYIEDVEDGGDYVTYSGRCFLVLMGYSTSSSTDKNSGETDAEFSNSSGETIITSLISDYCTSKDSEITSSITFDDIYEGDVKLHGKKVYQIVREMCQSYGYDLWMTTILDGNDNVTSKIINVGEKVRGDDQGNPHKTLYGGIHLKSVPIINYKSSQAINCLRVIGGGVGKDKVSVFVENTASILAIGHIEGEPYHSNMIRSVDTAQSVGTAIINAKKDPIEELHVELAIYIDDLEYGDWIQVIDTHSNLDTIKRIKKIIRTYAINSADTMSIELGEAFDNYQNIIRDLTKGDVDNEAEMTMAGGSLKMTANDPPGEWVRIDGGTWYGTDGQPHEITGGRVCAWLGGPTGGNPFPDSSNGYRKAVVQIHDVTHSVTSALGTVVATAELAQDDILSADAENIPIGIVILRQSGDSNAISDVHDKATSGKSYIYLDARPIIGSSISGYGGEGSWEPTNTTKWAASTAYILGDMVGANIGGANRSYECTDYGTSGSVEPDWTTTIDGTNIDNGAIWTCRSIRLVPINQSAITNMDIWVRPQGAGVVYLG